MDRLVKPEAKEVELIYQRGQKCSSSFKLSNLMHTMSVAVSLTTSNPLFSINKPFSIIPPLSSASYTLQLSHPSHQPPLSDPPDIITVRTSMLPTGKAHADDLRRLFSKPGPHVFRDAVITVSLIGPHVAEFLIPRTPENRNLFIRAISACTKSQLTRLLRYAVECGRADAVADLVDAGGETNGESFMLLAIMAGRLDMVKLLEGSGCGIDYNELVLHEAAAKNRIDVMEFLLERYGEELEVNSVDSEGRTPIHVAAREGYERVIEFCVSMGGNPNCVDSKGWTPLHFAAWKGHVKAVECLLECSNVKYARDRAGKTAFSVAEEGENSPTRTRLLDLLFWGDALLRAARVDDVHEIKRCIGEGACVNGRDQNGWTPLHWAAFKGRIKSVKVLLEHGAVVDSADDAGYTPLHCAAEAGHLQVALFLISHGASQANLKSFPHVAFYSFQKHVSHDCKAKTRV
ncbi:serine/threonine-protein phosphatase 6 regulatory ankyrin repeat subunit B-like [Abrus precatorius]|uniref:Serine/threonine-protein phosphatase 6 regulatory ankyrin repeat subunit B-like n=1 Tax=Abrus precatorius TaxID=3816 RepID=A0A8B8MB92_ABRPR|nr:serine/threonine-protein phosphatase 6 regulatory ankyrin repeat subunit B-like [Abrus precatorius]